MKQYNVTFNKTANIFFAIIFPGLCIGPFIVLLAKFAQGLKDWEVGIIIGLFILLLLFFTLKLVKKMTPVGLLSFTDDAFVLEFRDKGTFIPETFEVRANDIIKCTVGNSNSRYFLRFVTSGVPANFNLSSGSLKKEDVEEFDELMEKVLAMKQ